MANPNLPNDEHTPAPAGVNAGPQSGAGGAGGEPEGARLEAKADEEAQDRPTQDKHGRRPEHSSDKAQAGYRARPAGQSGVGEQDDRASTLREPQGEGNYVATDRGEKPLRNG
ncbi:hypothetical protein ACFWZU_05115 [Frateuria sp. GZRR33]|uniref:hypothetical protein n=1 Tax=Frateuria sp. GZRR33 TaxID=3351535 RepID=UPI003EDC57D7